jgi:transposase
VQLMGDRTREVTRLELDAGGRQHQALVGGGQPDQRLGPAMLTAMIAGERDPQVLAQLARGKLRIKIPQLVEALTGHFSEQHAQLARTMLHRLELIETALAELDAVIAEACRPWAHQLDLLQVTESAYDKWPLQY